MKIVIGVVILFLVIAAYFFIRNSEKSILEVLKTKKGKWFVEKGREISFEVGDKMYITWHNLYDKKNLMTADFKLDNNILKLTNFTMNGKPYNPQEKTNGKFFWKMKKLSENEIQITNTYKTYKIKYNDKKIKS